MGRDDELRNSARGKRSWRWPPPVCRGAQVLGPAGTQPPEPCAAAQHPVPVGLRQRL